MRRQGKRQRRKLRRPERLEERLALSVDSFAIADQSAVAAEGEVANDYDLEITDLNHSVSVRHGTDLHYAFSVVNRGMGALEPSKVSFYLSGVLIGEVTTDSAVHESGKWQASGSFRMNLIVPAKTYSLRTEVEPLGDTPEVETQNNFFRSTLRVEEERPLTVTGFSDQVPHAFGRQSGYRSL
ncbi:MAG: hypothetical protein AAFU85_20770, partial [Planctomycetota bacterium]